MKLMAKDPGRPLSIGGGDAPRPGPDPASRRTPPRRRRPRSSTATRLAAAETSVASSIEDAGPVDREGWGGRLGKRAGVAMISLCLVIGLAFGWLSRPADLLSDSSPSPAAPPGLWMAPAWKDVQKQKTPEAQYRYAQLRVSSDDPEAAWLAVPGHFPGERPWTTQAYIQLARLLLRRHDVPGLKALATEIEHWEGKITPEKDLAAVIRTALALFEEGDLDGVIKNYQSAGGPQRVVRPGARGVEHRGHGAGPHRGVRGPRPRPRSRRIKSWRPGTTWSRTCSGSRILPRRAGAGAIRPLHAFRGGQRRQGVFSHGDPQTGDRRTRRTDHRAQERPDRHRAGARLPHHPRPQRREPTACRDPPRRRRLLPGRPPVAEQDQGQQRRRHPRPRPPAQAGRPDQHLRRRDGLLRRAAEAARLVVRART